MSTLDYTPYTALSLLQWRQQCLRAGEVFDAGTAAEFKALQSGVTARMARILCDVTNGIGTPVEYAELAASQAGHAAHIAFLESLEQQGKLTFGMNEELRSLRGEIPRNAVASLLEKEPHAVDVC